MTSIWFDLTGNQLAMEQENVVCGTCDIERTEGSGGGAMHRRLKLQVNPIYISPPTASYSIHTDLEWTLF